MNVCPADRVQAPVDGEIQELDANRHHIRVHMSLPFGLISSNRIMCARIDDQYCTLRSTRSPAPTAGSAITAPAGVAAALFGLAGS